MPQYGTQLFGRSQAEDFRHRVIGSKGRRLKDNATGLKEEFPFLPAQKSAVPIVNQHLATRRFQSSDEALQERTFPGAVYSHENHTRSFFNGGREVLEELPMVAVDREVLELDHEGNEETRKGGNKETRKQGNKEIAFFLSFVPRFLVSLLGKPMRDL
ncbi:MAG: hypothetical protein U1C97_02970 [Candidatus Gracilibacteria bacterium]|nr:hypothetical protein [Candidatus Gracilibacteria bacterium]